jgi:hypothetical protein
MHAGTTVVEHVAVTSASLTSLSMPTEIQQKPSTLLATIVVVVALGYAAYLSPRHLAAAGLACMTASALIAAPELIEHLLVQARHPRLQRATRTVGRGLRTLSLVLYTLAVVIVALVSLGGAGQAVSISIFFLIVIGFVEISVRQAGAIVRDVATGGHVDERLERRFGSSARWSLAGCFFLLGTLIQLVGTFTD